MNLVGNVIIACGLIEMSLVDFFRNAIATLSGNAILILVRKYSFCGK